MTYLLLFLALNLGTNTQIDVAPRETINLITAGSGQPVVLIPGLSGCAYGYRKVVPILVEQGFQTIILEPLAIGSSGKPAGVDYSLTAQADRVAAVLDSLGVSGSIVVGHGVSASISLRLALSRPDLVKAIVSVEGGAEESAATPQVDKSLKIAGLVAKLGGGRLLRDRFKADLEAASGDKSWVTKRNVRKYFAPASRDLSASIAALREMARAPEPISLREKLHQIDCPVLLLTGGAPHEGGLSGQELAELGQGLSLFTHQSVPGAGHFIFEENPEIVIQAIQGLRGEPGLVPEVASIAEGQELESPKCSSEKGGQPCVR